MIRKYGITEEHHAAMLSAQDGKCPICDRSVPLVIDHCHRTGKVRALLCDRCNRLLGVADDDRTLLARAIEFLNQHT
ncbi:endonuclease VII domain-containing protein [Paramicrobacterium sp. CJ85]|uniref:endonuclease VII domain-containing protein n=1 Tax=Paramicrobacterium sp. CJ85 TaxID=3445355 RepID=UPI003F5F9402